MQNTSCDACISNNRLPETSLEPVSLVKHQAMFSCKLWYLGMVQIQYYHIPLLVSTQLTGVDVRVCCSGSDCSVSQSIQLFGHKERP